jgi:hypothetical protein
MKTASNLSSSLAHSLGLALGLLLSLTAFGASASAAEISSRPILFIHGFNPFGLGEDCKNDFGPMETSLTSQGYSGQKITIGYYDDDTNCDVKTSPYGTILSTIEDLSKDFAWYVYDQFSSHNQSVDVVTHSMGGLILRYALYRVAAGDSTFPPYLMVTHAATLAAPFTGYSLLAETCHINVLNVQCDEMFPLSSFIEGLKSPDALVPQGPDGTIWSGMGSNANFLDASDGFVNSASATSMDIPVSEKIILPWHMFVFHTMYTHNKTVIADMANILAVSAQDTQDMNEQPEIAPQLVQRTLASASVSPEDLASADAVISRDELTQDFSQLPDEQKPAKYESHVEKSGPAGVHFMNVLPGGVFAKMGIQDDDIIRGCKSKNINSPFEALDQLETSNAPISMKFCIVRGDEIITKHIVIQ